MRDGTVDIDIPDAAALKLDAVTLDGHVSFDAVEAKIAAHGSLWQAARLHAAVATESLATKAELEIDGLDAASVFARSVDAATVGIHPAATDLKLTLSTDGRSSATGELAFATPAFGVTRHGARLDVGAARARLTASYAPGDATLRVDELKLGEILPAATGSVKARPGAGGVTLDAALGRVDAGRVRAAALALANDVALVGAVSSIVRSGTAVELKVHAVADRVGGLADVSAYDVAMGVENASIDIPVPVMTLTGASGKVRFARGILTASNVAGTFDGSSLRAGELVLALSPTVAVSSLSVALDIDLAESHGRLLRMLSDSPLALEMSRVESISGRAKGTLAIRQDGAALRQIYDVTGINAKLRYVGVPLPAAIDGGGMHYETGGALVLRKVAGAIGASRLEEVDAEIAFAPGPVVRAGSGGATLALDELYPWAIALPALEPFRGEIGALQGAVGVKLARLAGPLATPGRLQVDAVLTPRMVRATSPRLPASLTIDGGTIRLQNEDLLLDGVDVALRDVRGTLSGSLRGYATPSPALDVSIARATIGPRGLEWAGDEADVPRSAPPAGAGQARANPRALARARAMAARRRGRGVIGGRGALRIRFQLPVRQRRDSPPDAQGPGQRCARDARLAAGARGPFVPWSRVWALDDANPRVAAAASGTLRGDFEATVDLTEALRSRADGQARGRRSERCPTCSIFRSRSIASRSRRTASACASGTRRSGSRISRLQLEGSIGARRRRSPRGRHRDDGSDRRAAVAGATAAASGRRRSSRRADAGRFTGVSPCAPGMSTSPAIAWSRSWPTCRSTSASSRPTSRRARVCGIDTPFTLTASGSTLDVKGRASARDLPVAAALACLTKNSIRAIGHDGRHRRFRGERNAGDFACLRARQRCNCAPATAASAA